MSRRCFMGLGIVIGIGGSGSIPLGSGSTRDVTTPIVDLCMCSDESSGGPARGLDGQTQALLSRMREPGRQRTSKQDQEVRASMRATGPLPSVAEPEARRRRREVIGRGSSKFLRVSPALRLCARRPVVPSSLAGPVIRKTPPHCCALLDPARHPPAPSTSGRDCGGRQARKNRFERSLAVEFLHTATSAPRAWKLADRPALLRCPHLQYHA